MSDTKIEIPALEKEPKAEYLRRPKAWIPFVNFALVPEVPPVLRLQDHMFPYEGMEMADHFIWGVYGTLSANHALFTVDTYARKNKLDLLTIQGWYRLDNFERTQSDEKIVDNTGYVHMERLKSHFRDHLHELMLKYAVEKIDGFNISAMKLLPLNELLVRYPRLIYAIFDSYPNITMVVHPVRQLYIADQKRDYNIATMRNIPSRIMSLHVRFMEETVKVTC